jgi:tetratricopeptide (TPR) repeat protein
MAGRFDEAVEQAKKEVEREPKNEFTYLSLADACILAGQEEEARAAAAEGLKINPEFSLEPRANNDGYCFQSSSPFSVISGCRFKVKVLNLTGDLRDFRKSSIFF